MQLIENKANFDLAHEVSHPDLNLKMERPVLVWSSCMCSLYHVAINAKLYWGTGHFQAQKNSFTCSVGESL